MQGATKIGDLKICLTLIHVDISVKVYFLWKPYVFNYCLQIINITNSNIIKIV